jgi:hypothetical protein
VFPRIRLSTRQASLMVEYPSLGCFQRWPRCAAIQRRPPRQHRCLSCCRPSPCSWFSQPRSTTATPPRPGANSGRCACPPTGWLPAGKGDPGTFPTFTDVRFDGIGAQLYPDGIARTAHRSLDPGLPPPKTHRGRERRSQNPQSPPAPQRDPSTRFDRPLTTHGASTAGSVSLHLSVFARGHGPSGGADPSLHCQGCSQPHPHPRV